jgi:hypothetical protein
LTIFFIHLSKKFEEFAPRVERIWSYVELEDMPSKLKICPKSGGNYIKTEKNCLNNGDSFDSPCLLATYMEYERSIGFVSRKL